MIHIFTITARNYLSLALTLGDSIAYHHPEACFTICVSDGLDQLDGLLPATHHPGHRLLSAHELIPREQLEDLAFKYNITEYCTAIKPMMFKALLAEPSVDFVYYMDPDTHLYQRLDPITQGSPDKTLYLAPHLIDCRLADDHPYPEYHHLWEGIFNLGFCAVRRTKATDRLLNWWDARLREYCYADHVDGLHTDQKWMDYAPVFFHDELRIVRHYGVNTAHWNLSERPLSLRDGQYHTNTQPLIFFHFSGFDFCGETLTKHVPVERQASYTTDTLRMLAAEYRAAVKANGYECLLAVPYAFATFSDGTPITQLHRRLYRVKSRDAAIPSPFSSDGPFFHMLSEAGLLDRSPAAKANYSKATVSDITGKLRTVERAMRWILGVVGVRRYVQLVKLAAWLGRIEHHHFLLDKRS
ncbi:hypothetical protein ACU6VG_04120 [Sphaerotilus sulfidivorans]|uniref:hypothetical protein n=1 Tax=Sphaerotilus sp. FB-3 TaxID=2913396 RepID=UPI00203E401B|nr:hypothetical protein [Sphaerotilus sp. FB-3]GKQ58874.1 hypothetical protein QMTAC487_27340 [Sphaerotilus sp. FB-3]